MVNQLDKAKVFYHPNAVLALRIWGNNELKTRLTSVYTLEKPKDEIDMIKGEYRNEREYYIEKKDSHYLVLKKDSEAEKRGIGTPLETIAVYHRKDHANKRVWKETKRYMRDLSETLQLKEWCDNKGKCHKSIDRLLNNIKVKI